MEEEIFLGRGIGGHHNLQNSFLHPTFVKARLLKNAYDHSSKWMAGTGKRTIGALLAKKIGARFIHNHLLHDVALVCTGFDHPERWTLYDAVRAAAYQQLAKHPKTETFVMTNALCKNAPENSKHGGMSLI
jgi:hypothetical protein